MAESKTTRTDASVDDDLRIRKATLTDVPAIKSLIATRRARMLERSRRWIVLLAVGAMVAGCGSSKSGSRADGSTDGAAGDDGAPDGAAGGDVASLVPDYDLPKPAAPTITYDGRVVVTPGAVLLTKAGETAQLVAVAQDAGGAIVAGALTWTSSRPEEVTVDANGLVTSVVAVGSAQITAKVGERVSAPVTVLVVAAYPGTTLVADAQIASGPELVDAAAPVAPGARVRATLTGVAAPTVGSLVVAREGKALAGRVVAVTASGADHVVELQLVPLLELFAQMSIKLDAKVDERALVAAEAAGGPKPVDTDATYGFVQSALSVDGWECAFSAGGESVASRGLSITSNVRIVPSIDVRTAFVKDAEGDWALLLVDLAGSVAATGNLGLKFMPAVTVDATCTATFLRLPVPIGGPLSVLLGFEVPLGLTGRIRATIGTAPFEVGVEAKATGTVHEAFSYTKAAGMQYVRNQGVDFGMKAKHSFPLTTLPATVKGELSVGPFTGLDVHGLGARAGLLRANFLGKGAFDFALDSTQLDLADYAAKYDIKPVIEIGPGSAAAKALSFFGGVIALRPAVTLELPDLGSKSPLGTLSVDKAEVRPRDTVEVKLTLDAKTMQFAGIDNVQRVRLYRESPSMKRVMVEMEAAAPGKNVYTWKWKPGEDDVGTAHFWAMTETTLAPFVPLEIGPDSKLTMQVTKPLEGGYAYTLDATTDCTDEFAGTKRTHHMEAHCTGMRGETITGPKGGLDEVDEGMSTCTYVRSVTTSSTIAGCTKTTSIDEMASGAGPGVAASLRNVGIMADTYTLAINTSTVKIPSTILTWEEQTGDCASPMPRTVTNTRTATSISPYWGEMVPDIVRPLDTNTPGVFVGSETITMSPIPHPCAFPPMPSTQISARSTLKVDWNLKR
jgi:hypothetical protein